MKISRCSVSEKNFNLNDLFVIRFKSDTCVIGTVKHIEEYKNVLITNMYYIGSYEKVVNTDLQSWAAAWFKGGKSLWSTYMMNPTFEYRPLNKWEMNIIVERINKLNKENN